MSSDVERKQQELLRGTMTNAASGWWAEHHNCRWKRSTRVAATELQAPLDRPGDSDSGNFGIEWKGDAHRAPFPMR